MKTGYYKTGMLIISLFIFSCQTDALLVADTGLNDTSLTGRWKWVSTDGGIAFHIHDTPASTGREEEWVFSQDMRYFKYVDGSLVSEGTYSLEKRKCFTIMRRNG